MDHFNLSCTHQIYCARGNHERSKPNQFKLPLQHGLMIMRKLIGAAFAGDKLTDKVISHDATRTTNEIHEYIAAMSDVGSII